MLLLALGGALAGHILWTGYQDDQNELERRATQASRFLEEQTASTIRSVDLVLQVLIDRKPFRLADHDPAFEDWMRRRLAQLPFVRALFIIGADGFITQDTDHPDTPRVSLADRNYFRFHKNNANSLHVAPPLLSRSVDRWFIAVSRRVERPDGGFAGLVVAAVEPVFYEEFYAKVAHGGDAIALWYSDGSLVARMPHDYGQVGQTLLSDDSVTRIGNKPVGTVWGADLFDRGEQLVVAYRDLPDLPLIVAASVDLSALRAHWWREASVAVLGFALLCLLSLVLPIVVFRSFRERAEAQRRTLLFQKSDALGRMTAGIAHDFNNFLASIDAGLRLAMKSADDSERVKSLITLAEDAVHRGSELTSRLLSFARGQEEGAVMADANQLLEELQPMLRQAAGSGVSVVLRMEAGLPECLLERSQFDAAILNLVINARDAMPEGGTLTLATCLRDQPRRRAAALAPGRYVVVRVSDTGPGIPPEVADHVFEPFFTTKGEAGTGLGLAQIFSFMREIGGDARVARPGEGEGAVFELHFSCGAEEGSG